MAEAPFGLKTESISRRFWVKARVGPSDECWIWTAARKGVSGKQYGNFVMRLDGKTVHAGAHRVAYQLANGKIPGGADSSVLHRCDTPLCVNPAHLFLGTVADNNADMASKGRSQYGMSHWNAKVSDEDVREIRSMVADGVTQARIAASFGISQSGVSRIVNGHMRRRS